jgi:decaprenyl-phosphate phosphoribosyltransferase
MSSFFLYLKLARVDHWVKNTFILPGAILAIATQQSSNESLTNLRLVLSAFIGTCLLSSANYTINEFLDRDFDALHPIKQVRTAVKFSLSKKVVTFQYILLATLGLVLLDQINAETLLAGISLVFMGLLYNVKPMRLKDRRGLDVISESVNNPLRLAIGWYSTNPIHSVPVSLLISFMGAGIFLMALKRYTEKQILGSAAGKYRPSLESWSSTELLVYALSGGFYGTTFLGVFLMKWKPEFVLVIPVIISLFMSYFRIGFSLNSVSFMPEKIYRSKQLVVRVAIVIALSFLLSFIHIPILHQISEIIRVS